jgi:tRNA pseudouridine38-40 synthase
MNPTSHFDADGEQLNLLAADDPAFAPPMFAGDTVRLRLCVAYLGTNFHGLAPQPKLRTVGGEIVRALTTVLHLPFTPYLGMSGRTDAGVHARSQFLHVDVPADSKIDLGRIKRSLTKMLEPEIVLRAFDVAPADFDARYSARWRRYRYTIKTGGELDPFRANTQWYVREELDLSSMRLACDPLIGEHDFTSFCRVPKLLPGQEEPPSMTRLLTDALWVDMRASDPGVLRFEVQANAFCQQMVRSIVGLMVEIGRGKKTPGDVLSIMRAKDRGEAAVIAPPHGLCLWEVGYDAADTMPAIREAASSATAIVGR